MLLKNVEAINSPYPLFVARDEKDINIIEFSNGANNLRISREEAKKILTLETTDCIKFSDKSAMQFWKPEDEEPEVMIYFYKKDEIDLVIVRYDEFKIMLEIALR